MPLTTMSSPAKALTLSVLALALAQGLFGQIQTGRISGTIYDPNKAAVPNASLTVTNKATNVTQKIISNESGGYVVPALNPGIYDISATAAGFRTTVRSGVEMLVGKDLLLDIDLTLGETTTVVEVNSEVPLLNSESGSLGHVMTNNQIVDLPLNGRGFNELARLTPGVVLLPGTGNVTRVRPEFFNGTTISGVRGRQVSYYLDGTDTSEQHQGGSWIQTSVDALQEFSVQQNAYSAEHSRSGSFFNATTKSGTNSIRGTLYEFLRNEKMDARNFFGSRRDLLKRNQFGASVGARFHPQALQREEQDVFLRELRGDARAPGKCRQPNEPDFGHARRRFQRHRQHDLRPSDDRAQLRRQWYDSHSVPRQSYSRGRLSPQAAFFNSYLTTVGTPGGVFTFSPSTVLDEDQLTTRIDHSLGDRNKIFFRYSLNDNRLGEPGGAPALGNANSSTRGQNYTTSITSNLRPTILNEFRFNILYGLIKLAPYLLGRDFNKDAGIKGMDETKRSFDVGSFPDFAWSGYASLAGSTFDQRPKTQDRYTLEFTDNLTWIKGKHVIKFGGKMRHYQWLGTDSKIYMGTWTFNGQNTENPANATRTGDAFADWALGLPANAGRGYPSDTFGAAHGLADVRTGRLQSLQPPDPEHRLAL